MKSILLFAMLMFSVSSSATLIDGVELGSGGNIKFVTSVFFDTVEQQDGSFISQGIGDVQQILNDVGQVLWSNGDNGTNLWFVYDDIHTVAEMPIFGSTSIYFNVDGTIDFFTLDAPITITGDYVTDSASIATGDLFFSGVGDPVDGWIATATSDQVYNTGAGQFEVIDFIGAAFESVNQQAIPRSDGSFTDFTFNYSSDIYNTSGYDFAGSADIAMIVNEVSEPYIASMFGLALGIVLYMRRREETRA